MASPGRSSFGAGPESVVSARDDSRRPSMSNDRDAPPEEGVADEVPEAQYSEHVLAANIPLPMDDEMRDIAEIECPEAQYPEHVFAANIPLPIDDETRDINEIEVPGLARDPDTAETDREQTPVHLTPKRRQSLTGSAPISLISRVMGMMAMPEISAHESGHQFVEPITPTKPVLTRQRSMSVPTPRKPVLVEKQEPAEKQIPGGFPVEETEKAGDTAVVESGFEEKAEQKADAEAMAAHKREAPPIVDPLVDESLEESMPKDEPSESKRDRSVFGKAAAGSAAAAAAAVTLVYGTKLDKKEARKSMPPAATGIEEQDRQKYLLDTKWKRLSVPTKNNLTTLREVQQTQTARKVSTSHVSTPARDASMEDVAVDENAQVLDSDARNAPRLDLSGREHNEGGVDIGVAKTSDTAVSAPKKDEPAGEGRYARDEFTNPAPRRQSRLILDTTLPDAPPPPARKESPPAEEQRVSLLPTSPEGFLAKRALRSTPKIQLDKAQAQAQAQAQSLAPNERTRSPVRQSPHRSAAPSPLLPTSGTNSAQPSPGLEKATSPWRQTFSTASEKTSSWVPQSKKPASVSEPQLPVQEHPVVQKISMKRNESRAKEEDGRVPLTSASIKGPEDFEMFVQGVDTVKYTLTPENVRRALPPDATSQSKPGRKLERTPSSTRKQSPPPDSRTGRSQTTKHATSASPPPPPAPAEPEADEARTGRNRDKRRSISRPPARNVSVHKKSGLMAREPQVVTLSTRDFADFIRSTGPTKEPEIVPIVTDRSSASLHSLLLNRSRSSSPGAASMRSLSRSTKQDGAVPPVPPMPHGRRKSKGAMQPRGIVSTADGTSELIDFIRTGPSTPTTSGQQRHHRISRTVAPFRTTMDSDQLNEWGDRIAAQSDLKNNTDVQSAPSLRSTSSLKSSSHRTSANSRSALLTHSSTNEIVHPAHSGQPVRLTSGLPKMSLSADGQTVMPQKTRVRNKDPYSIDFLDDDEEDEDLLTALPKNKREEESLIDFLRNSEPPNTSAPRPVTNSKTSNARTAVVPPRRSSAHVAQSPGIDAITMGGSRRGSMPNRDGPQPKAGFAGSITVPPRINTSTVAVGPNNNPRGKLEARSTGAKDPGGITNELASFLRSSGPGSPVGGRPEPTRVPSVQSSKASRKSGRLSFFGGGFFGRSGRKTYVDNV